MEYDPDTIRARIEETLSEIEFEPRPLIHDVAFHMTDWLEDLGRWHRFCAQPDSMDAAEVNELLHEFLLHVPNHLAAASKLFLDIPVADIFEVGATKDSAS